MRVDSGSDPESVSPKAAKQQEGKFFILHLEIALAPPSPVPRMSRTNRAEAHDREREIQR